MDKRSSDSEVVSTKRVRKLSPEDLDAAEVAWDQLPVHKEVPLNEVFVVTTDHVAITETRNVGIFKGIFAAPYSLGDEPKEFRLTDSMNTSILMTIIGHGWYNVLRILHERLGSDHPLFSGDQRDHVVRNSICEFYDKIVRVVECDKHTRYEQRVATLKLMQTICPWIVRK